jgi:exonuclease III
MGERKIIAKTRTYEVVIEDRNVVVNLFEPVYSEKEVLAILDAYQKALYERLNKERKESKRFVIVGGDIEYKPPGG